MTNNVTEQQLHTRALRLGVKKRSDKLINYFLASYFVMGLAFAFFYDTWLIAFGVGGLSLIAYYSVKIALPNSNLYQYVLSGILGIFMAQFIYQMHGMFEMHFFAFIGSAILITYQNWKLQIPMVLLVVIHHMAFGYLQNSGFDKIYFTQLDYFELQTFIIHVLLAAIIFFICGLWGYQLKKYSEIQIGQAMEMNRLQKETLLAASAQEQQLAVAESNKRFTYAAQATSDAIWERNYSEDTIFWGEGYRTLFGYDINPETMSVNFWGAKVHPEDLGAISKIIQEAKDSPGINSWTAEYRFLKVNGEYAFVREKAVILRDEKGEAARTIGALQDITASKQNEIILNELNENLEKEKYLLDSLMDNMSDSIYFKDRESRIIRGSKYMAAYFGTTVEDLIGKSDFDLQDEVHARNAYQDEQNIQKTRQPKIDYIEKEICEDESERWVCTTKMPLINAHGEVVGTFGVSRDITKVKMLERERHEVMLDKAVAQGKFEIASDVMHDIGNAVVGFGSYLTRIKRLQSHDSQENLQNLVHFFSEQKIGLTAAIGEVKADAVVKLLTGLAETQKSNTEEINRSISEQLNIIANIEEILNIQRQYITGHETQGRKPVNLRDVINDSLSMLFASIDKMAIAVSLNVTTDLPLIKGDRTKLMQIILNILKNSIEAIDITSSEKNISLTAYTQAGQLILKIKDNGKGFDKLIADQLFGKGFTTKSSGAGMGLYNCRTIAESHEGTIDITSEGHGKGSLTIVGFNI